MRRRGTHIGTGLIGLLLLLTACKPGVPKEYIQPDDMEDILYDYFVAQGITQVEVSSRSDDQDYLRDLYFNAVLKKHDITRAEFDSSLVYYYTRADYFVKIYRDLQERLSEDALALGASEGEVERFMTLSQTGDTANVWEGNRQALLLPDAPYNHLQFRQEADTTYRKGDSFLLTFNSDFLYQDGTKDGLAYLAVKYQNDSTASFSCHFAVGGNTQLRVPACDEAVKEISGYFYLGGGDRAATLRLLFLSNVQLIRFHRQKGAETPAAPAPVSADTVRTLPDSLRPRPHRLGERPVQPHVQPEPEAAEPADGKKLMKIRTLNH